jgi:hypothetical protein
MFVSARSTVKHRLVSISFMVINVIEAVLVRMSCEPTNEITACIFKCLYC